MCCYNNQNFRCCCRNRVFFQSGSVIPNNTVIIRPIFPVPTPFANNALYAVGSAGTVANLGTIPLSAGAGTPGTTLSVSGNALIVPAGTYQISFGATGNPGDTSESTFAIQLYANGLPVSGQTVSTNGSSTLPAAVSKTIIYTATATTALSLVNVSGASVTITNGFITAQKLA